MIDIKIEWDEEVESEIIVHFGTARLFERTDGQYQIEGGWAWEKQQAREWSARFLDVRLPAEV